MSRTPKFRVSYTWGYRYPRLRTPALQGRTRFSHCPVSPLRSRQHGRALLGKAAVTRAIDSPSASDSPGSVRPISGCVIAIAGYREDRHVGLQPGLSGARLGDRIIYDIMKDLLYSKNVSKSFQMKYNIMRRWHKQTNYI